MSEDPQILNRELLGENTRPCVLCEVPKPASQLFLISGETIGHMAAGNVDVCPECFSRLQQGDVEPPGDPEP